MERLATDNSLAYLVHELITKKKGVVNTASGLPANIILGWKRLSGSNTLAYWAHSKVTKIIKCCEYGPVL